MIIQTLKEMSLYYFLMSISFGFKTKVFLKMRTKDLNILMYDNWCVLPIGSYAVIKEQACILFCDSIFLNSLII
jgi:hypothetical protein